VSRTVSLLTACVHLFAAPVSCFTCCRHSWASQPTSESITCLDALKFEQESHPVHHIWVAELTPVRLAPVPAEFQPPEDADVKKW